MRLGSWFCIACVVSLVCGHGAVASDHVTLSVMPAVNQARGFDRRLDTNVRLFRERMVSALVEHYDCVVLSRSYGLELAREEALAGLREQQRTAPLLPADWVIRPTLVRGRDAPAVWQLLCTRTDGSGTPILHEAPFTFSQSQDDEFHRDLQGISSGLEIAVNAAHQLAQLLELPPRATAAGPMFRSLSAKTAIMPVVSPRTDSELRLLSASELIEFHLQQNDITTVTRERFRELIDEHALAAISDGTERLAGDIGALVGADILLRPVIHDWDGAAFSLLTQVIDTRTGALIGVLQQDFADPDDWVRNASDYVSALLDMSVTLPSTATADPVLMEEEAAYYIGSFLDGHGEGTIAIPLMLHGGLQQAKAAFALARHHPELLNRLLSAIDSNLTTSPPEFTRMAEPQRRVPEVSWEYRLGVGELMHETLDRLQALQSATEFEPYFRMRAFESEGNYTEALRIARSAHFVAHPPRSGAWPRRRERIEAEILFLLERWEEAAQVLENAQPLGSPEWWMLANCYHHAQRPLDEIDALRRSGWSHRRSDSGLRYLALMLEHASLDERLEDLKRERHRSLSLNPEYFYYEGRTWEDAGDFAKAAESYQAGYRVYKALERSGYPKYNSITGGDMVDGFREALDRVGIPDSVDRESRRAAELYPFPDDLAVYLQPVGDIDPEYLRLVAHRIEWFFGGEVRIFRPIPVPMMSEVYSEGRNQIHARRWRELLLRTYPLPSDASYLVFVTHEHLYDTSMNYLSSYRFLSLGLIASDYRFRLTYSPSSYQDRAEQLARSIIGSYGTILELATPDSLLVDITGSSQWPQSPNCITFGAVDPNTMMVAPSLAFSETVGRIYVAMTPEAVHRACQDANRHWRERLAKRRPFEGEDAYAEAVREAVAAGPVTVTASSIRPPEAPPPDLRPGLRLRLYSDNEDLYRLPAFEELEPAETKIAEEASINVLPSEGGIACVFEGWIYIPETGEYGFWLRSSDGSRLQIGDWTIEQDLAQFPATVESLRFLDEGYYPFRLEHFRHRNNPRSELTVRVTRPDLFEESIPAEWLFHEPPLEEE